MSGYKDVLIDTLYLHDGLVSLREDQLLGEEESEKYMIQVENRILFRVARWVDEGNRRFVEKIRELAETEENYMIIIRELDRVTGQITQARKIRAPATLTLMDWFVTLEDFHWQCAYCQEKPLQVMCHPFPLAVKGTTPENCVPACYVCCRYKKTANGNVQTYLLKKEKSDANTHCEPAPS